MHELSITSGLIETVEAQAQQLGAARVVAINLVAGERAGIVEESLRFYLEMLSPGTRVQGAQLHVRYTPMRFHCAQCGDYTPAEANFDCPGCGVVGQVADDGSGLLIESIEIETQSQDVQNSAALT